MGLSLLSIGVPVVAVVLFVTLPHVSGPSMWGLFARFVTGFAIAAIAATVLFTVARATGATTLLVIGDAAMVLSPSLLLVALCVWTGRRVIEASVLAFVLTIAVTIVSAIAPQPAPLAVRGTAVALACAACAWAALRPRTEPAGPLRLIAVVTAAYAIYTLTRMLIGVSAGWDSARVLAGFFFFPALVTGIASVGLIGFAVVWLRRDHERAQAALRRTGASLVVVGDWRLASAAYGQDRVHTLVAELRAAARDLDPAAVDAPRGVEIVLPGAVSALSDRVRAAYGWGPDEVALLSEGTSTDAIRVRPLRSRIRLWS